MINLYKIQKPLKMKHLKTFFSVLMILGTVSCNKNQPAGEGQVSFGVSSNDIVADVTRSNVSDYTALPKGGEFTISISDSSSLPVWEGKLSEWDSTTPLPAGNYKVAASYGDLEDEGFDKPYFSGETSFAVSGGETKSVSVPVNLANTVVRVNCTQNFRNYYRNYTFKLTRNGSEIVTFAKDQTKAAFVDGYKFTLEGVLEAESKTYDFSKEYTSLDSATAYTFVFDVDNTGGTSITISFNNNVETVNLGDIELND